MTKLDVDELNARARLLEAEAKKAETAGLRESRQSMDTLATTAIEVANDSPKTTKLKLELRQMELRARLTEAENRKLELQRVGGWEGGNY